MGHHGHNYEFFGRVPPTQRSEYHGEDRTASQGRGLVEAPCGEGPGGGDIVATSGLLQAVSGYH